MRKFYQHAFLPQKTHYFSSKLYVALIGSRFVSFAKLVRILVKEYREYFSLSFCHLETASPMTRSDQHGHLHPLSETLVSFD